MEVALYPSCENLPFAQYPQEPEEIFDPYCIQGRKIRDKDGKLIPVTHTPLWPLVTTLEAVEFPGFVAHVSAFTMTQGGWQMYQCADGCVKVQITTVHQHTRSGEPIIVADGSLVVLPVWLGQIRECWLGSLVPLESEKKKSALYRLKRFFELEILKFMRGT